MKNSIYWLSLPLLLGILLAGCGGSSSDKVTSVNGAGQNGTGAISNATGSLSQPNQQSAQNNLTLGIIANDPDGLKSVYLIFNQQSAHPLVLCSDCGRDFADTLTGINPGLYGAQPGPLEISLWVEDNANNVIEVATSQITWIPPIIEGVNATRSGDGQQISVSWQNNPELLRYNLYIATQSGVNSTNFSSLENGQGFLAVESSPQVFSNLEPALTYFLLITGIDGSGESTNMDEIVLEPGNSSNSPPVANDDDFTIDEDSTEVFSPLDNDTDADNDPLVIEIANASSGQLSFDATSLTYTPVQDFNGTVQLTYTIVDGQGGQDSAQIEVTILAVNDPPQAVGDDVITEEDTDINIDALDNDFDIDGDALLIIDVSGGLGNPIIESDNTITYSPPSRFVGVDDFEYTIEDADGETATATVTVNVFRTANSPIAFNDNYEIGVDTGLEVSLDNGVLSNDASVDGNGIRANTILVSPPAFGQATIAADGSFEYQPNTNFVGDDSFDYELIDDNGLTATARVSISVRTIPDTLQGDSLDITGDFLYIGLGETQTNNGIGSGRYRVGNCTQLVDTVCTFTGRYQEAGNSGNDPSGTGHYSFTQHWQGVSESPVLAESDAPNSVVLRFFELGSGEFELALFPDNGGSIRSIFPDDPFSESMGFGAFIQPLESCQGLPNNVNCDIGQVGLVPDATLVAPLDRLNFTVPGTRYGLSKFSKPIAVDEQYQAILNTTLDVDASNGLLSNDNDPDSGTIGDNLVQTANFSLFYISNFVGMGFDQYRQQLVTYSEFENDLNIFDLQGELIQTFDVTGDVSNAFDIDIVPETFSLADVLVPQGSALLFNGVSGQVTVYAVNLQSGNIIVALTLDFGEGEVVGGTYNEVTNSLFVVQSRNAINQPNTVAQIDTLTGEVISTFSIQTNGGFSVESGDIDANSITGNLYLVSSIESDIAEFTASGDFVRRIALPNSFGLTPSGMSINHERDQVWLSGTGTDLSRLEFENGGIFPQWQIEIIIEPDNGIVEMNEDGSFSYQPNTGFIGEDRFIYQLTNAAGQTSLATASVVVSQ